MFQIKRGLFIREHVAKKGGLFLNILSSKGFYLRTCFRKEGSICENTIEKKVSVPKCTTKKGVPFLNIVSNEGVYPSTHYQTKGSIL